jgi:hypothetical protein
LIEQISQCRVVLEGQIIHKLEAAQAVVDAEVHRLMGEIKREDFIVYHAQRTLHAAHPVQMLDNLVACHQAMCTDFQPPLVTATPCMLHFNAARPLLDINSIVGDVVDVTLSIVV